MKSIIDKSWVIDLMYVLNHSKDRQWFKRESWRIMNLTQPLPSPLGLHPAVYDALMQYAPVSWHAVVLELPHIATDGVRVAYTRNDEHGEQNRQTVTTVGKYLKRHFPNLRDDVIRDLVALHSVPQSHFKLLDESTDQFISYLKRSADSCMNKDHFKVHPYHVYAPELGWRLAVRLDDDGDVLGRALVNVKENAFVRSYSKNRGWGADVELESWLKNQGIDHLDNWRGCRLKLIKVDNQYVAPYLDGDVRTGDLNCGFMEICEHGEYEMDNVSGFATLVDSAECEDCNEYCDEDEMNRTYCGRSICQSCADRNYVWSEYSENYVHEDNAVYVDAAEEYMHEDDVGNAGYVYIESRSEWHNESDCVMCESDGNWYHQDDLIEHEIMMVDAGSREGEYWDADDVIVTRDGQIFHNDDLGDLVVCITIGSAKGEFADVDETETLEDNHIALIGE